MVNAADVVIWSADVPAGKLDEILVDGCPVRYVKLDRGGLTRMGLQKIAEVQSWGFKVFADAKIWEIPEKATAGKVDLSGLAAMHLVYKPWMLNCSADICSTGFVTHENPDKIDGLKRFADLCHTAGTKPCAVTVLTSKSSEIVAREFGGRTPIEQVLTYVEMLLEFGFTDVVCSPEEVPAIRADSRFDGLELNTPGIRLPESNARDQARFGTPSAAIAAGANRLVIGSDLTNGDFATNFQRIANNLNQ